MTCNIGSQSVRRFSARPRGVNRIGIRTCASIRAEMLRLRLEVITMIALNLGISYDDDMLRLL